MSNTHAKNEQQTFLTALPDGNERKEIENTRILISAEENDDDLDIDIKTSSSDTDDNDEVNSMMNNEQHKAPDTIQEQHKNSLQIVQTNDGYRKSEDTDVLPIFNEHNTTIIPRSLYDYAATVHEMFESPRYSKLHHDVSTVLGSADPPPGFGFLHPRFYYLEQKRPVPMQPLKVWRGYNGHVYFEPIKCTRLENERETASVNMNDTPLEIDKNSKRRSLAHNIHTHQQQIKRSHSTLSPQKQKTTVGTCSNMSTHDVPLTIKKEKVLISNQSTTTYYEHQRRQNLNSQFSNHSLPNDVCVGVDETLSIIESSSKLNNNTLETFIQEELNESMWQSVKSCAPTKTKPTSKRSKHLIEDAQNTQQEQSIQDSTVYHRQVLPNIKAIPKYKNVYKGLAYKEGKKLSNNNFENDASKPLVSYNLAPAYTSFETNVYKDKSQQQQNSLSSPSKEQPTTAVYDIKEIRKRIIKGTTLPYRPSHSTSNRIRGDGVGSETSTSVSGVKVKGKLIAKTPLLNDYGFLQSSHTSINMTTPDSNHKQLSLTDVANITSPLKTKTPRAHKNNSVTNRSRTHHTTPIHSQQQSSVFSLTPRFNTVGETTIVF